MGTPTPFNVFPYRGGHIPPSFPSLGGSHQQSVGQPIYHSLFGAGSQGPPSHSMPVGSTPFSLLCLITTPSCQLLSQLGATSVLDNLFLCRVLFLYRGHTQELLPQQGLGILGRDQFPHKECRSVEILFIINGTPDKLLCLSPWDRHGATLPKVLRM